MDVQNCGGILQYCEGMLRLGKGCWSFDYPFIQAGFEACEQLLPTLQPGHLDSAQAAMDDIRARLVKGMGLAGRDVEVVLHPSGTDAEYIPLLYAVQRAEALGCSRVVNVIAAAGEVGSHTATAAGGKHISNFRPMGGTCVLNEPVEGFNTNNIKVSALPCTDMLSDVLKNPAQLWLFST